MAKFVVSTMVAIWAAAFGLSSVAQAGATFVKPGFAFPRDRKVSLLVAYPDVSIRRQGQGGQEIPDPAWTSLAQRNLRSSLESSSLRLIADLRFMTAEDAAASPLYTRLIDEYHKRTGEIIFRVPQDAPDVTKASKCRCTYNFSEIKDAVSSEFGPADYVMLINQQDTYANAGQIIGEIAGATAEGIFAPSGAAAEPRRTRTHAGNAILFDLKTGDVVWMHGDGAFGGDLRNPKAATVRVKQALSRFPGLKK